MRCEIRYNFVPEKHPSAAGHPFFQGLQACPATSARPEAFRLRRRARSSGEGAPACDAAPAPRLRKENGGMGTVLLPTGSKRSRDRPLRQKGESGFGREEKRPSARTGKVALPSRTSHPSLFPTARTSPKKESSGTKVRLTATPAPTDDARVRRDSLPFPGVSPQEYRKSARPRRPAPPACPRCG